jgi:malonate decarboxylase gamma subunit
MRLAEILGGLFPAGHGVVLDRGLICGRGVIGDGGGDPPRRPIIVIGVDGRLSLGVDEAVWLSRKVLDVIAAGGQEPILVMIDSDSQRMTLRDELLGLNEFLAHLAKCLLLADAHGHATVGLLYGHTAAGAFLATALATRTLLALPGADPEVMDLPSMARVTKLSIDVLRHKAHSSAVFAPGLDNLVRTGGVATVLDPSVSLAAQLELTLDSIARATGPSDARDQWGKEREGRPKAADIARRIQELARAAG